MHRQAINIHTGGRGLYEITGQVAEALKDLGVLEGLCHCFIHHTSASLCITENADPQVLRDMEAYFDRQVPDGDALFRHTAEGPDDMPAHVRNVLTATELTVPVTGGRLALGTWQGIFVFEHRHAAHERRVTVTVLD